MISMYFDFQNSNVRVQLVAVFWIREFLEICDTGCMLAHSAGILKAVLSSVANDDKAAEHRRESHLISGISPNTFLCGVVQRFL